jgi:hypothetical protein
MECGRARGHDCQPSCRARLERLAYGLRLINLTLVPRAGRAITRISDIRGAPAGMRLKGRTQS